MRSPSLSQCVCFVRLVGDAERIEIALRLSSDRRLSRLYCHNCRLYRSGYHLISQRDTGLLTPAQQPVGLDAQRHNQHPNDDGWNSIAPLDAGQISQRFGQATKEDLVDQHQEIHRRQSGSHHAQQRLHREDHKAAAIDQKLGQ